jgi:hypothetical protein
MFQQRPKMNKGICLQPRAQDLVQIQGGIKHRIDSEYSQHGSSKDAKDTQISARPGTHTPLN